MKRIIMAVKFYLFKKHDVISYLQYVCVNIFILPEMFYFPFLSLIILIIREIKCVFYSILQKEKD